MKIICDVRVLNRSYPHDKPRVVKSTLALGFHPMKENESMDNLYLVHFTAAQKTGMRYKITRNIDKVFTKFVNDGKATLSLKQPPHDLQILCNPVELKAFLQTLKNALEGKWDPKQKRASVMMQTGVPQKARPATSMTILKPSDYPLRGLPLTLQTLNVNGIRKYSLDNQILALRNLQILDMSDNRIEHLPKRLGDLKLVKLNLSKNRLGNSQSIDWDWLDRPSIKSSLQDFNLSDNELLFFPHKLVRLRNLRSLNLNNNHIARIPFAIRRMKLLRQLFLSSNRLKSLPNSFLRLSFETVDISGPEMFMPPFYEHEQQSELIPKASTSMQPSQLWQIAANVVLFKNVKYGPLDLPTTVINDLEEFPICDCGKLCPPNKIHFRTCEITIRSVSTTQTNPTIKYADSVYCSDFCRSIYQKL